MRIKVDLINLINYVPACYKTRIYVILSVVSVFRLCFSALLFSDAQTLFFGLFLAGV